MTATMLVFVLIAVFNAVVVSAWNWAAMRRNTLDHSGISERLGAVEKTVDLIFDKLFTNKETPS